MTLLPAITDTPPPSAAATFDVRTLSDDQAHAFGVAVASMSLRYDALKAENAALRRRVALQRQTIVQLRRTAGADPDELLRRIGEVLGDETKAPIPVKAKPLPRGTVLGAVRVERERRRSVPAPIAWAAHDCAADPEPVPQVPVGVEEPHVCGPDCAAPKPAEEAADGPAAGWFGRLRWRR